MRAITKHQMNMYTGLDSESSGEENALAAELLKETKKLDAKHLQFME